MSDNWRKNIPTYTFDASLTVEAESKEEAADKIIFHCIGRPADIAVSLHEEGTLNTKRIAELQAQVDRECVWTHGYDYEEETWESACGYTWVFMEGDCKDNNVIYCQGCGGKVVTAAIKGEES